MLHTISIIMKKNPNRSGISMALLAAFFYALSTPISKILLNHIPPTIMAGLLYIGAGMAMAFIGLLPDKTRFKRKETRLGKAERPYVIAMVLLDITAPILLMFGLKMTNATNASLLTNFETVATSLIALLFFKETISARLWVGILCFTFSSILLTIEDLSAFQFSAGSLFVLLAYCCWGVENNCTRKLSSKDPRQIVLIKGFCSGAGSLGIGLAIGERFGTFGSVFAAILLGCVAFGLSSYVYVYAQRYLGASRTSAYYSASPFIGAILSFVIFKETLGLQYMVACMFMIVGASLSSSDSKLFTPKTAGRNSI